MENATKLQEDWKNQYKVSQAEIMKLSKEQLSQKSSVSIRGYLKYTNKALEELDIKVKKIEKTVSFITIFFVCTIVLGIIFFFIVKEISFIFVGSGVFGLVILGFAQTPGYKSRYGSPLKEQIGRRKKIQYRLNDALEIQEKRFQNGQGFPKELFYKLCANAGIKELNDEFSLKKARMIMKEILDFLIPSSYHDAFLKCMTEYFESGQKAHTEKVIKWNGEPHPGTPSEDEARVMNMAKEVRSLKGLKKREHILASTIRELKSEIKRKEDGEKAALELAVSLEASADATKGDWAFWGGIADGIAGPGAGAAVALSVMAENERIAANNRAMTSGAVSALLDSRRRTSAEKYDLIRSRDLLNTERENLNSKVVLSEPASQVIYDNFEIVHIEVNRTKTNLLEVRLQLSNQVVPAAPDGVHIVADGTLQAKVYDGETYIGDACIPLPLYGIECGKTETITGYCPMYMEGDRKYTVKLEPNYLWLMEL